MNDKINNIKTIMIKIFNKMKYPLEFIFSLLFIIGMYKFITVKSYEGYWSRKILIYLIFTGIVTLGILIYNCIKDKDKIENIFLNFAIPIGLMYAIFMMPTYTPDAGAHIWKAYELSEGIFITKINDEGESLTTVPKALTSYGESILTKYSVLNESKNDELVTDYNTTVDVNTPAKGYFSLFYVIYAVAFLISRTLSLNMIIGLFLARILNYILVLVLGYISIKKIPFGKILLAVYLMIPMMLQQATAISVDSLMNAIIIFFISYILSLMFNNEDLKKKEIIILLVLSAFIGLSKVTYIPLLGLGLILLIRKKDLSLKKKILFSVLAVIVCLGSMFALSRATSGFTNNKSIEAYLEEAGVNSQEQINGIIRNPVNYLKVLYNNFKINGTYYLYSCIGEYMGWLTIMSPIQYVYLYIAVLFAAIFVENNSEVLNKKEKIWTFMLALLMDLLIVTGLYIEWSKVNDLIVLGVQGRYFLPVTILMLLCLCQKENYIKIKNPNIVMLVCSSLVNLLFIKQIILFFI